MERWVLLRKGADFEAIGKKYQISPRLACLIRNRDVIGEEAIERYLNGTISDLYDGMLMKDADKAIDILKEKIAEEKKIRVIGDYDIDGVCSTCILYKGLSRVGASVEYVIPERIKDGYGINEHIIEKAAADGIRCRYAADCGDLSGGLRGLRIMLRRINYLPNRRVVNKNHLDINIGMV